MFTGAEMTRANIAPEDLENLRALLEALDKQAREACATVGIPAGQTPFGRPANFLAVIIPDAVYLVVDEVIVGGMPDHIYLDRRLLEGRPSLEEAVGAAVHEFGFQAPLGIRLPIDALGAAADKRSALLASPVIEVAQFMKEQIALRQLGLPVGYDHYQRFMQAFIRDHPRPETNVLLMMRFQAAPQYVEVADTIRKALSEYGLNVVRADDKDYTRDLWENVCVYMLGCRYGVAVFEEIDERDFNPNIALELGFMSAHNKRCLILKDRRMPRLPTDIIGKLYKEFDTYQIQSSVAAAVGSWAHDIGLTKAESKAG